MEQLTRDRSATEDGDRIPYSLRVVADPLIVVVPVVVAALGNENDTVAVINATDVQGSTSLVSIATMRSSNSTPRS